MRPRISIRGSVRPSVSPSVGWSVRRSARPSVTLLSRSNKINIFEKIRDSWGILGPLYVSSHLYKTVYRSISLSISLSIHWSACHASVNINKNLRVLANQSFQKSRTISYNRVIMQSFHQYEDASLALWALLDSSSHLYMRVCLSVGLSIGPSVRIYYFCEKCPQLRILCTGKINKAWKVIKKARNLWA